ncbi:helix-turn-helix domain-containing protein [Jatrophihabitans lederbergiae]|uniref:Helix-turn-helix domain-containing protein n=1 Tax=Jatrophihabitans lederbergiae TaxID=3075547 RepID=A0ABU2JIK2_9ACTN|nr:helix-turn-helix domain-containing protein [Jatrophihabitans sp. DSM 44399]MDT0264591.1 helix-turn-helix domain-containing protein [Jatrophihabitans sp. DSM 44399]
MATANDELGSALARSLLPTLLSSPDAEALLETLRTYLQVGSVSDVADQTYRHRNTIRNRLRLIEERTGLALTVPRDVAALTLALAWLDSPSGRARRDGARTGWV